MPGCEICGQTEETLTEKTVSQATLMVCSDCSGEETSEQSNTGDSSSTKYSTSSTNTTNSSGEDDGSSFEELDELKWNYGDVIEKARNRQGLTLLDLADRLNEKESHLREVENGNRQPSEDLQNRLENELGISLTQG